jgi:hypothetical protein
VGCESAGADRAVACVALAEGREGLRDGRGVLMHTMAGRTAGARQREGVVLGLGAGAGGTCSWRRSADGPRAAPPPPRRPPPSATLRDVGNPLNARRSTAARASSWQPRTDVSRFVSTRAMRRRRPKLAGPFSDRIRLASSTNGSFNPRVYWDRSDGAPTTDRRPCETHRDRQHALRLQRWRSGDADHPTRYIAARTALREVRLANASLLKERPRQCAEQQRRFAGSVPRRAG